MNKELLKEKSKAYFDNTTCEDIIKKFEVIGYTFVPMTTLASAEEAAKAHVDQYPRLDAVERSAAIQDFLAGHAHATEQQTQEIKELREFIRDCADNWDCDEDGHKYNTGCRKCNADILLNKHTKKNLWL